MISKKIESKYSQEELVEEFFATHRLKKNTLLSYEGALRRYLAFLKNKGIVNPNERDLNNYRDELEESVASASLQKYVILIRRFYIWCDEMEYYPNIARHLKGATISPTFQREALDVDQVKRLLRKAERLSTKSLKHCRDYVIVRLIITTGLRTVEVSRANVEDLTKVNGTNVLYIQGKGRDDKAEYVKLPDSIKALIDDYLVKRNSNSEALFLSHSNANQDERITPRAVTIAVKTLLSLIGLDDKKYTAHSLRHTCATLALKNGSSIQEVQALLRHKSINTTTIYLHNINRESNNTEFIVDSILPKVKK